MGLEKLGDEKADGSVWSGGRKRNPDVDWGEDVELKLGKDDSHNRVTRDCEVPMVARLQWNRSGGTKKTVHGVFLESLDGG